MNIEEHDFTDPKTLRRKAEELLKQKQKNAEKIVLEADAKKLLHELQVHQIELEMQNEELRRAYETAETALKKHTMLYDLAPMGYLTLEKSGEIVDLNFTAADMLGDRRFSLVNSNINLYILEESVEEFKSFIKKVFSSKSKESCEILLGHDSKSFCQVYMEGVVIGDSRQCLLSVVDISNFRK